MDTVEKNSKIAAQVRYYRIRTKEKPTARQTEEGLRKAQMHQRNSQKVAHYAALPLPSPQLSHHFNTTTSQVTANHMGLLWLDRSVGVPQSGTRAQESTLCTRTQSGPSVKTST